MLRNRPWEPNNLVPTDFNRFNPKQFPCLSNGNLEQTTLDLHQIFKACTRPVPASLSNNGRNPRANFTTSIINDSVSIPIKQITIRMPWVKPQINLTSIPYFKAQELFSNTPKLQKLFPTPWTVLGNSNLPKTLPLQFCQQILHMVLIKPKK